MRYEPEPEKLHLKWNYEEKNRRYHAVNIGDEEIGFFHLVKWGRHIHWSWRQEEGVDMSPGCLEEVREKQKELFKDRKLK